MENNNIFEGAKFGDKFATDGNEIAIYQKKSIDIEDDRNTEYHTLITPTRTIYCHNNGEYTLKSPNNGNYDIVSRYQEPIDEEKLDKFAKKETGCLDPTNVDDPNYTSYHCYVAGYRKAKEE